jgi:hypothetical protein
MIAAIYARKSIRRSLLHNRVRVGNPAVNPAKPTPEVPWRSAEMHRAPVNRNAANVGGMVGGREGGRLREGSSAPADGPPPAASDTQSDISAPAALVSVV